MGSGRWSAVTFHDRAEIRERSGRDVFDHSVSAKRSGNLAVHQTLDPRGLTVRQSRDSEEHPASNAIIIGLDVTGSMDRVVRGIHGNLPKLHEMLLGHNYISDPQIMFAAVGDATSDRVPLQVGQFESDNRMDQNLENMILEGAGGPGKTESYELLLYLAARHTAVDCWEKRKHKGYLFIIGDEMAYPAVKHQEIKSIIGGGLQADMPLENVIAEAEEKYHVFYIIPGGASHGRDKEILEFWHQYLGPQRVLLLDKPEDTSQCIALTIGVCEGAISMDEGLAQLQKKGVVGRAIDGIAKALSGLRSGGGSAKTDRPKWL